MYQRILVPIDGSSTSSRGLAEAIQLAKLTGGRLRLVHVVPGMQGGTEVEIARGLAEGERVVAFPDDRMRDGLPVQPLEQTASPQR